MSNVCAVRIDEKVKKQLEQIAVKEHRSFAQQVELALEEWLNKKLHIKTYQEIEEEYNYMLICRFKEDHGGKEPSQDSDDPRESYLGTWIQAKKLRNSEPCGWYA